MAKVNQAMQDLLRYNHAIVPGKRSLFDKSHSHATTLDSAFLVPFMWDRVVPGDEKKIRYSGLARMATPLHATMDEAYLYTWAFYIPDRLWWHHAKEFYGENLDASFNPDGEYRMPSVTADKYMFDSDQIHSLSDYFGLPYTNGRSIPVASESEISVGLWRCYQLIWNEYYRNTSIQPALRLSDGDTVSDEEWSIISQIRKVNKLPDMFTSLLLEPQAGDDVLLPLGEFAPVVTRTAFIEANDPFVPMTFMRNDGEPYKASSNAVLMVNNAGYLTNGVDGQASGTYRLVPSNLWADLSSSTSASVNTLRSAITIQQFLEINAIGGKRYQNLLFAHFGCFTPDSTLQRPELLGATKTRIGMRQTLSTNGAEGGDLGRAGGVSVTNVDNEWICNKGFTEPGFIMVLGAVRPLHSYSQGVNPLLRKLNTYDHYYPVFDNLGNQPVYVSEVYAMGHGAGGFNSSFKETFTKVLGYKEAWQEYRMMDNRVSGLFRPNVEGTLSSWNYTTHFTSEPVLNSYFIEEDETLLDRTIATPDEPQFLLDSYFEYHDIKNMSVHSTPGLMRL